MAPREKITSTEESLKVFINCPFDNEYLILLRPLLFTVIFLGFEPLIASQRNDSGELRINKILELIKESDLSIHDISRVKAKKKGDFFRLNMPFELGIDWGYRYFNNKKKNFLVLESESHTASRALSDFSGCDPKSHEDDPALLVRVVRDWLVNVNLTKSISGGSHVWDKYNFFYTNLYSKDNHSNEDIEKMPISEFILNIKEWMRNQSTL